MFIAQVLQKLSVTFCSPFAFLVLLFLTSDVACTLILLSLCFLFGFCRETQMV